MRPLIEFAFLVGISLQVRKATGNQAIANAVALFLFALIVFFEFHI